jgi:hypothetical protein
MLSLKKFKRQDLAELKFEPLCFRVRFRVFWPEKIHEAVLPSVTIAEGKDRDISPRA